MLMHFMLETILTGYAMGVDPFDQPAVEEAKLLASFDHPALVKIQRVWADNGTAYLLMPLAKMSTEEADRAAFAPPQAVIHASYSPVGLALARRVRQDQRAEQGRGSTTQAP